MRGYVKPDDRSPYETPEGYRCIVVSDPSWRVLPHELTGKRCRRMGVGHVLCNNLAVAEFQRGRGRFGRNWWAYCADHLYGRWIENGAVVSWRLEKEN